MTNTHFPVHSKYKCLKCDSKEFLEIWAFIDEKDNYICPVLVCNGGTGHIGCGRFFTLEELGTTIEEIRGG